MSGIPLRGGCCFVVFVLLLVGGVLAEVQPGNSPRVDIRLHQEFASRPAFFTFILRGSGGRLVGRPRISPFYGHAVLMENTLGERGFGFRWDVSDAIRAARGRLRRTKIYIHWTLRRRLGGRLRDVPMLTALTVSLSPTGRVAVARVVTSAFRSEEPVGGVQPPGPLTAAVWGLGRDATGGVCFRFGLVGGGELVGVPTALVNRGRVEVRPVSGRTGVVEVRWVGSARASAASTASAPVPGRLTIVVAWTCRTPEGGLVGGRTALELALLGPEVGLISLRTETRLQPPPTAPPVPGAERVPGG